MDVYFLVKTLHIISSTVLFGTGTGIAFFMAMSCRARSLEERAYATRMTVLGDTIFTAPAVIIQPMSGAWLIWQGGYDPLAPWLLATYALYALAGLCWLPVVWIQIRLNQIVQTCIRTNQTLPETYHRLFRIWLLLGFPAFSGLIVIFWLMVTKPA